jgi:hypothetical protein
MPQHGGVRKRSGTHYDDDEYVVDNDVDGGLRPDISRADGNDTQAEKMTSEN